MSNREPIISSLMQDEPELYDLVEKMVLRLPKDIIEIKALVGQRDLEQLKKSLHKLKGTAGNFGFGDLHSIVSQMENCLSQTNLTHLTEYCYELDRQYLRMHAGLSLSIKRSDLKKN